MKKFGTLRSVSCAALAIGALSAAPAAAEILVFKASNYEAGPGKHGLWTNNTNSGADRFYAFQPDMLFTVDTTAGTATMTGTAINPSSTVATINLSFGGFLESTNGTAFSYKKQGGLAYDAVNDINDVDFFSSATGTIDLGGTVYSLQSNPFAGDTLFQYGLGANAKNADFGGSSWLMVESGSIQPNHWDINFNLTSVPEPSTWAMLIFGFGLVGGALRRKKSKIRHAVSYA